MKNLILILFFVFQLSNATESDSVHNVNTFLKFPLLLVDDCDGCGSASGGGMGFASMLNSNFIGIRYFNQLYKSNDGLYSNSPWNKENFNTTQIWARIPIGKNIQISTLIPYHFHERAVTKGKQSINGIGDVTLLIMYQLHQTHKDSTFFTHILQMGAGIKSPTGKFNESNTAGSVNPSFQVGTGSWDYLLATEYIIRRKQFGINTMFNYVIKTENEKMYRFGNQMNYAGTFFYLYQRDTFSLVPQLGLAGEVYQSNYQMGQELKNTAGDVFFSKIGFEMGKDKFSLGANIMLPIHQNLNGGNLDAKYRWSLNVNYSL